MTRLYVVAQMFVYFMYFLLLGSESEGGVSGAAALTAPGWQQPPSPAGVHVPPPGVCHQHGLLQPLDWAAVTTQKCGDMKTRTCLENASQESHTYGRCCCCDGAAAEPYADDTLLYITT